MLARVDVTDMNSVMELVKQYFRCRWCRDMTEDYATTIYNIEAKYLYLQHCEYGPPSCEFCQYLSQFQEWMRTFIDVDMDYERQHLAGRYAHQFDRRRRLSRCNQKERH